MIRIQEASGAGDDAVAVMIGVTGEGDVEAVFQGDEARHGVGRGAIHADLAIPIDGHEAEGGVDLSVDNVKIKLVPLGDTRPVGDTGSTEGVHAELQSRPADGVEIDGF